MKRSATACLAISLMAVQPFAFGEKPKAANTYTVTYAGGSITDVKAGKKLALGISADTITLGELSIPVKSISAIDLTQDKHHRIGTGIALSVVTLGAGIPVMFSKSTKDFIALTYKGGGVDFQADKKEYRGILAQLQGVTGLTATQPEPAKK